MTNEEALPVPPGPRMTAADLRREMAEIQMAKAADAAEKRAKLEAAQMEQIQGFLAGHVDGDDLSRLRLHIQNAVAHGHTEVEVIRFPSSLLKDKGRAINSGNPDWPATLTGKAETYYRLYQERAAPEGYKLEARILDYPGGLLGDVGMFLTWGD